MHCSRVDAFRHRADPIIADPAARDHGRRALTLTDFKGREAAQNVCRATNVIRHGLCPILPGARAAVNPLAASFAIISASL
jgi:hypothetical protein